jgi:xylulose-5-phosphate/fructose-6-phosphate phosphoketolase
LLPILHLNGYKINKPSILPRIPHDKLESLFRSYGCTPYFVEGNDPNTMHQMMAASMERCVLEIRDIQAQAHMRILLPFLTVIDRPIRLLHHVNPDIS